MASPIKTRPSFPFSQSLPSESFHKPLNLLHQKGRHTENHNHRKLTNLITWTTAFSNSMKLWVMPRRALTSLVAQMVKNLSTMWETQVWSLSQEDPLEKKWQPTPVLLPGKSHGQRSMVGYSPWGRKELDTIERLTSLHFTSRRAIQDRRVMVVSSDKMWSSGERNGKLLQYSCLENTTNSRQNDRILKEELSRSVGAQYATGDQ